MTKADPSAGLPPLAWLNSRSYGRLVRTLAGGGDEAVALASRYAASLAGMGQYAATDPRVLAKNVVTIEVARERGYDALENDLEVRAELRLVQALCAFLQAGRQVFEFSDNLVRELGRTDVDQVFPSDLRTPYEGFYLRLPGALPAVEGHAVDGVLVQNRNYQDVGPSLVLDFMPTFTTPAETARAIATMPIAMVPLRGEDALGAEIDVANWRLASPDYLKGNARKMGLAKDGDWYERSLENTRRRYEAGLPYVQANLPTLVNALLFIDNCRREQSRGWSADAPADLVAKTAGTVGAAKAEQKLAREGWTRVTLCQVMEAGDGGSADANGRAVRAHWRRGHWRRQAVGPGRARTTLVRVRPTMVGAGKVVDGRTYHAS